MTRSFITTALVLAITIGRCLSATSPQVTISFDRDNCAISVDSGANAAGISFRFDEIVAGDRTISLRGQRLIVGESLFVAGHEIALRSLSVQSAVQSEGKYWIVLTAAPEVSQSRRGRAPADRFAAFETLVVAKGEFVRGNVLAIGGVTESHGEVNGNIISLFGDIELKETATCHRDVFSVGGRLYRHTKTRIYGAYQSTESWKRSDIFRRRKRLYGHRPVEWMKQFTYNRVDGASITGGISFQSEENAMPRFYAEAGYALSAEQWKYRLGFEHRLFDYHQFVYGGSVHRQTRTDDDWLCGINENTLYALLFKQDWRDYYEGEGAELFVEQHVNTRHRFRLSYVVEELDSLPARPRLWSLLGPSDFRSNFSSLAEIERGTALQAYSGNGAEFNWDYVFATLPKSVRLPATGWWAQISYQHSSGAVASDFAYDRWRLELRRFQELTKSLSLNSRAAFGRVTGSPPPHRLFYLGGIRTLRAHDPKEYPGRYMALLNLEYLVNPSVTILDFGVLFDIGTVGNQSNLLSRERWRGDFGVAVTAGEFLRLELTLPFNGSSNELSPSILIGQSF